MIGFVSVLQYWTEDIFILSPLWFLVGTMPKVPADYFYHSNSLWLKGCIFLHEILSTFSFLNCNKRLLSGFYFFGKSNHDTMRRKYKAQFKELESFFRIFLFTKIKQFCISIPDNNQTKNIVGIMQVFKYPRYS